LPQLSGDRLFLTDGGLETTLIFHEGIDLPSFAAFDLLKDEGGREAVRSYYRPYLDLARERNVGFILGMPTWRANPDWGTELGYGAEELDAANRRAVEIATELKEEAEDEESPIVITGEIGPRGDGYQAEDLMSAVEAQRYHAAQIASFADAGVDLVTALTMTYPEEAIGVARAAAEAGLPSAISFTVETDGRLPNGQALGDAIEQVERETGGAPAYYMVNCAHPTHFEDGVAGDEPWRERIAGIRANASSKSHAELDEATELDDGDPQELGGQYRELGKRLPRLNVLGGCCGTDHRHVAAICDAWSTQTR
jgi:S-methylmethionine-dependent homocysteine/selenocysteine methylase